MKHTTEELRAICDAALNERWEATDSGNVVSKGRKNNRGGDALVALVYAHDGADHRFFYQCECDTAKFIAAADPPTVRALLDEIEQLRELLELKEWSDDLPRGSDANGHMPKKWKDQFKNLEADNERMKAALESIAANTCCDNCQEAKLVAQAALKSRGE